MEGGLREMQGDLRDLHGGLGELQGGLRELQKEHGELPMEPTELMCNKCPVTLGGRKGCSEVLGTPATSGKISKSKKRTRRSLKKNKKRAKINVGGDLDNEVVIIGQIIHNKKIVSKREVKKMKALVTATEKSPDGKAAKPASEIYEQSREVVDESLRHQNRGNLIEILSCSSPSTSSSTSPSINHLLEERRGLLYSLQPACSSTSLPQPQCAQYQYQAPSHQDQSSPQFDHLDDIQPISPNFSGKVDNLLKQARFDALKARNKAFKARFS